MGETKKKLKSRNTTDWKRGLLKNRTKDADQIRESLTPEKLALIE